MKRSVFVVLAVLLPLWSPAADVPLLDAIRRDDQPIVRDLIKKGGAESVRDESGATALMYAAVFASPATLQLLLESGADINASNNNGSTALMWAAGDPAKVRLLLDRGAAFDGNVATMHLLLGRGADPNRAGKRGGITPLMMAAAGARPSEAAVRLLLEKGADVQARDERGRNALDWALTQGETPLARLLR